MSKAVRKHQSASPPPSSMSRPSTRSPTPSLWTQDRPAPDATPIVAVGSLRKLIAYELSSAGFDSAARGALEEFEGLLWAFFATFLDNTHQYATHARRTGLTAKDILRSCEVLGLGSAGELMEELSAHLPLDPSDGNFKISYDPPVEEAEEGPLLDSDDEESYTPSLLPFLPLPAPNFTEPFPEAPPNPFAAQPLLGMEVIPNPFAMAVPASMAAVPAVVAGGGVMNMLPNPFDSFPNPFALPPPLPPPPVASTSTIAATSSIAPLSDTFNPHFIGTTLEKSNSDFLPTALDKGKGKSKEKVERKEKKERGMRRRRSNERMLQADFLPPLPPKHSYRTTPVFPRPPPPPSIAPPASIILQLPSALALAHLSTIRSRLANSEKVASSLRNLIRSTAVRSQRVVKEETKEGEGKIVEIGIGGTIEMGLASTTEPITTRGVDSSGPKSIGQDSTVLDSTCTLPPNNSTSTIVEGSSGGATLGAVIGGTTGETTANGATTSAEDSTMNIESTSTILPTNDVPNEGSSSVFPDRNRIEGVGAGPEELSEKIGSTVERGAESSDHVDGASTGVRGSIDGVEGESGGDESMILDPVPVVVDEIQESTVVVGGSSTLIPASINLGGADGLGGAVGGAVEGAVGRVGKEMIDLSEFVVEGATISGPLPPPPPPPSGMELDPRMVDSLPSVAPVVQADPTFIPPLIAQDDPAVVVPPPPIGPDDVPKEVLAVDDVPQEVVVVESESEAEEASDVVSFEAEWYSSATTSTSFSSTSLSNSSQTNSSNLNPNARKVKLIRFDPTRGNTWVEVRDDLLDGTSGGGEGVGQGVAKRRKWGY